MTGIVGNTGTAANLFNFPWNIVIDSNNTLYIADRSNSRIQKWYSGASNGTTIAGTTTSGSSATQFANPLSVWINGNNIYVADSDNHRVQMFVNGSMTGQTIASNQLGTVLWIEIDSSNSIYTVDMDNNTIWKNQSVFASGSSLNGPQGTAVMANGSVLITNTQSHTILMWNPGASSGIVVAGTTGSFGSSSTLLHFPTSVVVDWNGNFWVVDNSNHRVQFYCRTASNTTAGQTVAGGSLGSGADQLNYPVGLALDADLNLYVTDTSNQRIQRYGRIA